MNAEQNNETMAALWAQFRRKPNKCYCPCKKCKGLKTRRILITTAQSHCRQHGHVEGGHEFRPLLNVDFLLEEDGGVNIQAEDNTLMDEDDNVPEDMIEEDGIGAGDEETHNDGTSESDNDDEDGLDISLLEKAHEPLYEGSQTTLLSAIVLLVNLKVMNGISNVAMSRMLRYVIFVIFNVSIQLLFIILIMHICCCRLISEFLLPSSNILPRSYRELSTIMNQI